MSNMKRSGVRLPAFAAAMLTATAVAGCAYNGDPDVEDLLVPAEAQAIRDTTLDVLENNKVGESASWSNAETGARGTVIPIRTYEDTTDGPCREFQQTLTKQGETAFAYGTACRRSDGTWDTIDYSGWHDADERRYSSYRYGYDYPYPYHHGYWHRHHPFFGYGPRVGFGLSFGHRFY